LHSRILKWKKEGVEMKVAIFLLVLLACSFALSDAVKQCVKACCENSGGTYLADSNGCVNPGNGSYECSMACQQTPEKPASCIGAVLPLSLIGIAFVVSRK
jgi:hypothetical protein